MKKYEMVVFDMAGTTINEGNVVYKSLHEAINEYGFEVTFSQVLEMGAGKEKLRAICDITKKEKKEAKLIFDTFKKRLNEAYQNLDVRTFEGVEETFIFLKRQRIKVVLNTGYDSETAHLLLSKLGWSIGETINGLITADDVDKGRPEPDMILLAMKKWGIEDSSKVIKIGDSAVDIQEGKNAGCGLSIGVTTGAQTPSQLKTANPHFIINSIDKLQPIVSE